MRLWRQPAGAEKVSRFNYDRHGLLNPVKDYFIGADYQTRRVAAGRKGKFSDLASEKTILANRVEGRTCHLIAEHANKRAGIRANPDRDGYVFDFAFRGGIINSKIDLLAGCEIFEFVAL